LQLSRIWNEELRGHRVGVIAIDPGDMDTPMYAAALPDADRSTLKRPGDAAREILDLIERERSAARTGSAA
jgi:NAD(P)-dependent dehydrogenase (short-subunit alcohol dehydrogenase family)